MSSEDRLFAVPAQSIRSGAASCPPQLPSDLSQLPSDMTQLPPSPPQVPVFGRPLAVAAPLFSVVGGRLVQQPSGGGFPLNGQQLQLQLDQLTSAMTDMAVEDETMEVGDLLILLSSNLNVFFLM
jgi:hypothetical protein